MSEIRYGKATLPECCRRLAGTVEEPYRECLWDIYEKMKENTGESFAKVFRSRMTQCLETLGLEKEDREHFLHFTAENSFADGKMQLRSMEQSRELLKTTIEMLEREKGEKCRMAVGLGAMSGLLLIIVLL